jgi:Mg-chelatase subunit ChlD
LSLEIHPLPEEDGVLISVHPPKEPSRAIKHVPCDIVLVIDVSGSMGCQAPVPAEDPSKAEQNGLTVLDLTKHAARTILETLDENDRLGVVTFSNQAEVVQKLIPMTEANKKAAWSRIDGLRVDSMTNLWHGILEGIKLFNGNERSKSVPAVMVLTDGMPNHM